MSESLKVLWLGLEAVCITSGNFKGCKNVKAAQVLMKE